MDLPNELELLQVIEGDAERIACETCAGTGTAPGTAQEQHGQGREGGACVSEVTLARPTLGAPFHVRLRNNRDGETMVLRCPEDSPLTEGDIVTHVNGIDVRQWGCNAVCQVLRGNTEVTLRRKRTRASVVHQLAKHGALHGDNAMLEGARQSLAGGGRLRKRSTSGSVWLFENGEGRWEIFEPRMTQLLESARAEGAAAVLQVQGPVYEYEFDLEAMTQTNTTAGGSRCILRLQDSETLETHIVADAARMIEQEQRTSAAAVLALVSKVLTSKYGIDAFTRFYLVVSSMCAEEHTKDTLRDPAAHADAVAQTQATPRAAQHALPTAGRRGSQWFWQADAFEADAYAAARVLQPGNYVMYALRETALLERHYQAWLRDRAPGTTELGLFAEATCEAGATQQPFYVDFGRWVQTSTRTGTVRRLYRVSRSDPVCRDPAHLEAAGAPLPVWQYQGKGGAWATFHGNGNAAVEACWQEQENDAWAVVSGGRRLTVEFASMVLTDLQTSRSCPVRRVFEAASATATLAATRGTTTPSAASAAAAATADADGDGSGGGEDWQLIDGDAGMLPEDAAPFAQQAASWAPVPKRVLRSRSRARRRDVMHSRLRTLPGQVSQAASSVRARLSRRSPQRPQQMAAALRAGPEAGSALGSKGDDDDDDDNDIFDDDRGECQSRLVFDVVQHASGPDAAGGVVESGGGDGAGAGATADDAGLDPWVFVLDHDFSHTPNHTAATGPPCWVCHGSGQTSKWLAPAAVATAMTTRNTVDNAGDYDCCICYSDGQYALSTSCGRHYYCADCIRGSLESMLEAGQFPGVCPQCRADGAGGRAGGAAGADGAAAAPVGEIDAAALSFLQRRGIIGRQLFFRFLKAASLGTRMEDSTKYFSCPAKCERFLMSNHPSYQGREPGKFFEDGEATGLRLGLCPCGSLVCVLCNTVQARDGEWHTADVGVCQSFGLFVVAGVRRRRWQQSCLPAAGPVHVTGGSLRVAKRCA